MTIDAQLLGIFRDEAAERLDRMEATLLGIEAGLPPAGAIDELFRDAHSIKGSAGMVGLAEVSCVAGAVEDVLEQARACGTLPSRAVAPILCVVDAIRGALDGKPIDVGLAETVRPAADQHDPPAVPPAVPVPGPTASNGAAGSAGAVATRGDGRMLRVAADRVDALLDATGEAVLAQRRMQHVAGGDEHIREELDRSGVLLGELQHAVIGLRTLPFSSISGPLQRALRDAASAAGVEVRLELEGVQTPLDRTILDGLADPLVHLLRNAIAHGIETPAERELAGKPREGCIRLSATPRGDQVVVVVADDGRGVQAALLERAAREGSLADVLAAPGFSTADVIGELSGRGVGLDAVKRHVESLGGSLEATSGPGLGTEFVLLLPATLAVLHLLLVERDDQPFGIPLAGVLEAVDVPRTMSLGGRPALELRGEAIPLLDLADVLGMASSVAPATGPAVIVAVGGRRAAVRCDRLVGEQETVVKPLGSLLAGVSGYLGAAILGDGRVALICDPGFLARGGREGVRGAAARGAATATAPMPRLLVVDDQITIRELQRSILGAAGYEVFTARDGREALDLLARTADIELVLTDIEMPVLDGFALLETIRADPQHGSLPVVIVSSRSDDADRRRGAEAGADAYVVKSDFDQRTLLATVQRLVETR